MQQIAATNRVSIWQLLWRMILYAPKLYLIDSILWMFIMGLPAVPGLIIREFFNTLTNQSRLNFSPQVFIALFLAVGVARIVAIFTGRVTKTQHRFTMSALLRRNLLEQLLRHPGAQPLTIGNNTTVSPGEVLSYFREDAAQVEDNVVGTNEILGAGVFAIASMVVLFSVNAQLTLFVFLPLVAIAMVVQQAEKRIKHYRRASRQATQQVTGLIGEMFTAVQAIQIAGAETSVLNHFRQLNEQRRQLMVRDQVFTTTLSSVLENLVSVGTGLILLIASASQSMASGVSALSVGDFALFVYYLAFATNFLWLFGDFLALSKQTEVAFERMAGLLAEDGAQGRIGVGQEEGASTNPLKSSPIFPSSASSAFSPLILIAPKPLYLHDLWGRKPELPIIERPNGDENARLHELTAFNLTYSYPGTDRGITDINLVVRQGSFTVITGRVGSGKTTLLRVLLGLLPKQEGVIYWNNCRIDDPANFFIPPRSAYTSQVPQLFSHSLRENILLGLEREDNEISRAIALAVFDRDLATMPEGLETAIGPKGVRLSGGQLQRAAAARMFVHQPELLVFDDLSSALDVETEQILWSRLFAARNNSEQATTANWTPTCLVVSHRRSVLRRADNIIVLENGRVEAQGKFNELLDLRVLSFESDPHGRLPTTKE